MSEAVPEVRTYLRLARGIADGSNSRRRDMVVETAISVSTETKVLHG